MKKYEPFEKQAAFLLSEILQDKNYIFNNDKYYDIYFIDKNIKFKVKKNNSALFTKNYFIEYEFKNRKSGIYASTADTL